MLTNNIEFNKFIKIIKGQTFDPELPSYIDELYPQREIENTLIFPNQYFYIVRATDLKFIHTSSSVENITGYTAEEFPGIVFENIHPDDKDIVFQANCAAYQYGQKLNTNERSALALQVSNQMKKKNGEYFHQLRHTTNIRSDRKGHLLYSLSICTNITDLNLDRKVKIKIFDSNEVRFSLSNDKLKEYSKRLSKREKEIVDLLCKNFSSKQIADFLFVSRHTVDTHRRNIIKKLELTDTRQIYFYQNI
ncbi:MAG: LuxR C-terminal-related transcriptional regulator [Marinifilum sp.]|jgi:PAS domain S-box-containing protein|nr:LuxR C-terminal-related transcriptional regulator [Marinifilum sp.]